MCFIDFLFPGKFYTSAHNCHTHSYCCNINYELVFQNKYKESFNERIENLI